jgi:hypothetical protein
MKLRVKLALGSCKIYELDDAFPAEDSNDNNNTTGDSPITTTMTTSIRQLKTIIAGLTAIPVESQKLIYLGHILGPDEAPFRIHQNMRGCPIVAILVAPVSSSTQAAVYWGGIPRRDGWPARASQPGATNAAVVVTVRGLTGKYVSFPMNPYHNTVKDIFDLFQEREGLDPQSGDLVYRGTRLGRREYNLIDYGIGDGSGDDGDGSGDDDGGETSPAGEGGGETDPAGEDSALKASTTTATTTTNKTYYVHMVLRIFELGTRSSDLATVRRSRRLTALLVHLPVVLYPRALARIGRERHALLYALHHLLPPDHMVTAPAAATTAVYDGSAALDETNKPMTQLETPSDPLKKKQKQNTLIPVDCCGFGKKRGIQDVAVKTQVM